LDVTLGGASGIVPGFPVGPVVPKQGGRWLRPVNIIDRRAEIL
jgi:hypothetical protein